MPHRETPARVRESAVMGRTAVAVCIACWQIPAIGYLLGLAGSVAVSDSGSPILPFVWSGCFLVSGALMLLVYRLDDETEKAVTEIGALVVFTAAMLVYLALILERASTLNGRLAILSLLLSLLINLVGRAVLLGRQVRFVRRLKRERGVL